MSLQNRSLPVAAAIVAFAAISAAGVNAGDFDAYRWSGDSITIGAGNSQANNIAVQMVDPWPRIVKNSHIGIDGSRALIGIDRYKQNQSIPPRGLSTQSITEDQNGAR